MSVIDFDIRLFCRFYHEPKGWEVLLTSLLNRGWRTIGNKIEKEKFEIQLIAESEDKYEVFISLKSRDKYIDPRDLRELLEPIISNCWYADVYYCFRNIDFERIGKQFNLDLKINELKRIKINGVEVVLESYPSLKKIIFSYRVSIRELEAVKKIHPKLLGQILMEKVM
ncbi:MAG: hypothetical protein NZ929_04955 [Aigarchaeota archaeon]|nr:hypothetical protein [Aigarchaeota archaeon]